LHVVVRTHAAVRNLRRKQVQKAFAHATRRVAERAGGFRAVHVSLQRNHVHFLIEASDRMQLARGMQALQIAAARRINRLMKRRGAVFTDRYHASPIASPRQAHHALAYVLNNWRRHGEHLAREHAGSRLDPFATGRHVSGWTGYAAAPARPATNDDDQTSLWVAAPRTWLLTTGWRRYGTINYWTKPGAPPPAKAKRESLGPDSLSPG
jgi:REP element-mobilizing transposase RayT